MKARRKIGKTIYKSKKKRALDPARVQQETKTRTSSNKDGFNSERVSESKITNLKTGKESYMKTIDERDSDGNYSLRQMQSSPGKGGTYGDVSKGEYISFDKNMKLSSGGKEIKEIDPITLGNMAEASANKFFKKGGKMKYNLGGLVKSMMPLSMKAKMKEGGKIPPQKKPVYGPPKPPGYKEPSREELKERKDEAAYLKRRKEADRAYESVIKDGGTKEQATKAAEKVLSRGSYKGGGKMEYGYGGKLMKYLKGGQVKLDANKDGKITGADFMMLRKKK